MDEWGARYSPHDLISIYFVSLSLCQAAKRMEAMQVRFYSLYWPINRTIASIGRGDRCLPSSLFYCLHQKRGARQGAERRARKITGDVLRHTWTTLLQP